MNYKIFISLIFVTFVSCTTKNQLTYLHNIKGDVPESFLEVNYNKYLSEGDILDIKISSTSKEIDQYYNLTQNTNTNNIEILKLNGYTVDKNHKINLPIIGEISVKNLTTKELEKVIVAILIESKQLLKPNVNIIRLNSKFTVLGEVKSPGTFNLVEKRVNIFQALGYAGDLTIDAKRKIKLIREVEGKRNVYYLKLNDSKFLSSPLFYVENNDVIIVDPSFSKVKSAGFIGSASSLASISSLVLSIAILITNSN